MENFKVLLAPNVDLARTIEADATVEAEYGFSIAEKERGADDVCIEGTKITLAHHGNRTDNPAPCNAEVEPLEGGTILVSHLDLDTVGGVLAVMGIKPEDELFWKAAEFIDVNGVHHLNKLTPELQDKFNAFYAWNNAIRRERMTEITDVMPMVEENIEILTKILDEKHPEHDMVIKNGQEWYENIGKTVESKLVKETDNVRAFMTDGVFCASSYYSPESNEVKKATVTLNSKTGAVTVAFADGGAEVHAGKLVNELWGEGAGGSPGIGGSPRGAEYSTEELVSMFENAIDAVEEKLKERALEVGSVKNDSFIEKYGTDIFNDDYISKQTNRDEMER